MNRLNSRNFSNVDLPRVNGIFSDKETFCLFFLLTSSAGTALTVAAGAGAFLDADATLTAGVFFAATGVFLGVALVLDFAATLVDFLVVFLVVDVVAMQV